jgi:hypothetical protein
MTYDELVAQLRTTADAYAAERAAIDAWYDSQLAAARESLVEADDRLATAEAALATAGTGVEFTDAEAARLWGLLADRMKVPAPSLGTPPGEDGTDDGEHPGRRLDRVRELLDEATPARVHHPVRAVLLALVVLALVAGAIIVALTR